MPYESLREFMDRLEAAGRLCRVSTPVSPNLEITEIQTRLLAEGGPAVLFENVVGDAGHAPTTCRCWPTCSARSSGSLGAWSVPPGELREIGETLAFLRQPEPPGGLKDAWDKLPSAQARSWP